MGNGTKSHKGRVLGRPRTRFNELKTIPTRCPEHMYLYLKGLYPKRGWPSLTAMYDDMLTQFIDERPWEHGLTWRKPQTTLVHVGGLENRTGWIQVNIQVDIGLAKAAEKIAHSVPKDTKVSMAMFAYTAIFWWIQYIHPPQGVQKK